jgi:hypothetical protein
MQRIGLSLTNIQNSSTVSLLTIIALKSSSPTTATTTAEMEHGTPPANETLRLLWETFSLLTCNVSANSRSHHRRSLEGGWSLPDKQHEQRCLISDYRPARGEVRLNELVVVLGPFARKVNLDEVTEGCHVRVATCLRSEKACQTKSSLAHAVTISLLLLSLPDHILQTTGQ